MGLFANRVKSIRKERGWTQDDLAKRVGVSRSAVGNWEQGLREPEFETLEAVADVFNVDLDYLVGNKAPDLSVDERYVVECMRSDYHMADMLLSYAKFLTTEGKI